MLKQNVIHVSEDFVEMGTTGIDERKRLSLGKVLPEHVRVKVFRSSKGNILLKPVIEVPASEAWLFKNKKALKSVQQGLQDAAQGRIEKVDPKKL